MQDSLSKTEQIKFKKDISGFEIYLNILEHSINYINSEIEIKSNPVCLIELNRFKTKIEKDIIGTKKRIEMLK